MRSSSTPAVASAGLVMLVFLLALCYLLSLTGPRCSTSWSVCINRTVMHSFLAVACARLVLLVFCTSRCVPLVVLKPTMPCIIAGQFRGDILADMPVVHNHRCLWFRLQ